MPAISYNDWLNSPEGKEAANTRGMMDYSPGGKQARLEKAYKEYTTPSAKTSQRTITGGNLDTTNYKSWELADKYQTLQQKAKEKGVPILSPEQFAAGYNPDTGEAPVKQGIMQAPPTPKGTYGEYLRSQEPYINTLPDVFKWDASKDAASNMAGYKKYINDLGNVSHTKYNGTGPIYELLNAHAANYNKVASNVLPSEAHAMDNYAADYANRGRQAGGFENLISNNAGAIGSLALMAMGVPPVFAGAAGGGTQASANGGGLTDILKGAATGGSLAYAGSQLAGIDGFSSGSAIDPVTGAYEGGAGVPYGGVGQGLWEGGTGGINAATGLPFNPSAIGGKVLSSAGDTMSNGISGAGTAGKAVGFMDYLNAGLGIATTLSGGGKIDPGTAQNAVDPFAPYRPAFAGQLANLMANPNSITQTPGFQFLQQQGNQAVERTLASRGKIASGNELLALKEQDQGLANQQYNDQFNKLAALSGASQSPASGGSQWGNAASANIIQDQNKTNNLLQLAQNPAIQQGVNKLGSWAAGGFV